MVVLFLNVIVLFPIYSYCISITAFLDPSSYSNSSEHYTDSYRHEYAFFSRRVTWDEASVLCSTKKGSLIAVEDEEVGTFIAQALSESAIGYDALWIGGHFKDEAWEWVNSEKRIEIPASTEIFPMDRYPYWVEEPTLEKSQNQSCLALNRLDHDSFLLAPLPCDLARPFICGVPASMDDVDPVEILPAVEGEHNKYTLYYASLSWKKAAAFCLDKGKRLATLNFHAGPDSDFFLLSERMLRSRPVIENAWINGKFDKRAFKWLWISENIPIATIPPRGKEDKKDPSKNDPPWFRGSNIFQQGCLLLDRHLTDHPVFVEARCERKRSFICQEVPKIKKLQQEFIKVGTAGGSGLFISTIARPWERGLIRCHECFKDGGMLNLQGKLADDLVLKLITDAMAHMDTEVRHAWLAGHLDHTGEEWHWVVSAETNVPGELITKDTFQNVANKTNNIQVSIESLMKNVTHMKKSAFPCLNIDRANQRHVFLYGLDCRAPQIFFCESKKSEALCGDYGIPGRKSGRRRSHRRNTDLELLTDKLNATFHNNSASTIE